ncbi:hypothetical protein [Yinghuangia soli]|uniref:Uncharacterized protein n=1 Tax=Yinghuangia soli TaxID=2908204 RepID=A0AA41Q750_9ACTN|nr:hypothetical protein [Yinghuangia soli]MCF2532462.1 hypothetical protein [Yinghuangia soli]
MSRTRRLVTAAVCAVVISAGTVLTAGPAAAVTGTYDCEFVGSGTPNPDYDDVSVDFFNNGLGRLFIVISGVPVGVDVEVGEVTAVTSGTSPISLANGEALAHHEEIEVETAAARAVPSPLPTMITFTVSGIPMPLVCVKQ